MSGFILSPGITPELTDLFVIEVPVLLGVAILWRGRRGLGWALVANALALGIIKFVTDTPDLFDDVVSIGAMVSGLSVASTLLSARHRFRRFEALIGLLALAIGAWKAARDFYDPFDLLLADMLVVNGLWLIAGLPRSRPTKPRGWAGPEPGTEREDRSLRIELDAP